MWNQQTSSHFLNNAVSLCRSDWFNLCGLLLQHRFGGYANALSPPARPAFMFQTKILAVCSEDQTNKTHESAGRAVTSRAGREAVYLRGANEGTSSKRSCVNGMVGSSPSATESADRINRADRLVPVPSELLSLLSL